MKYFYKSLIAFVTVSLLLSIITFSADLGYRFTHNYHDTLIIGEITSIDGVKAVIRAADYIVSSQDLFANNKKEQFRPEIVTVDGMLEFHSMENAKVGDFVVVDLNKSGEEYIIANCAFPVDSLDYKTLKVTATDEEESAMFTDFVNSGGIYTEYGLDYSTGTVTRTYDRVRTVIYQRGQPDTSTISQIRLPENKVYENSGNYELYIIYGMGVIVIMIAIVFITSRKRK